MNDPSNRISHLLPAPQSAGEAVSPAPADGARHTTIINSDRPVLSVQFGDTDAADDGRWFMSLNWLVDSGAWASLSNPARSVLFVLSRHRRSSDSTSLPAFDLLVEQSGFGRSTVYDGIKELRRRGLIRELPHGAFEMFPGRAFAGRKPAAASAAPASQVRGGDCPAGRTNRAISSSPPDNPSSRADKPSSPPDVLLRLKTSDVEDDTAVIIGGVDVIAECRKSGMESGEAERFIDRFGAELAWDSLQNARWFCSTKRGKGYTLKAKAWQLARNGVGLFDEIKKANRKREVERLLKRYSTVNFHRHLEPEEVQLIIDCYPNPGLLAESGLITVAEADARSDDDLAVLVFERVAARAGVSP